MLHRYGRGVHFDASEHQALKEYWEVLDGALQRLHTSLVEGESVSAVEATAAALQSWPAVGVAQSEEAMRSLLMLQFERMRQKRIAWNLADGSTYPTRTRDGMYLLIDWARHG